MEQLFISNIRINKVRHLEAINITLSEQKRKHLLLTGKNGSGKTSLLEALSSFFKEITWLYDFAEKICELETEKNTLKKQIECEMPSDEVTKALEQIQSYEQEIEHMTGGIMLEMNQGLQNIRPLFCQGKFIVAYYKANRAFKAEVPKHVEKVELQSSYTIEETPRKDFVKYLLDLKMTEALALTNGKQEKAYKIKKWYARFEELLRMILENDSVRLEFDEDTFRFSIHMDGREPFDFNTLSSGYAAVLDIVVDLIMRMESQTDRVFDFSLQGIVLIDEIETHLHLELQKKILVLLTTIFPNIQFIVTTHSPFILNSLEDVTIFDLEKKLLVENGLSDIPYSGVVEGYFDANTMSMKLENKFERYKELVNKSELTDDDFEEIADLEMYLEEIPDYLALNITTEYQRLKMALRSREDI